MNFSGISRDNVAALSRTNTASKETDPTVNDFKKAVGKEDFDLIIDSLRCFPKDLKYTRLEFKIHDETKRIMVRILDRASNELISEVPPEKFLDLIADLWIQAGLIVDEKV
jgi:flagellar protein FlaG